MLGGAGKRSLSSSEEGACLMGSAIGMGGLHLDEEQLASLFVIVSLPLV